MTLASLQAAIDRLLAGSYWRIKALLIVLAISLFRAFPSYDAVHSPYVDMTWQNAQAKFDNPMLDSESRFPPDSHDSQTSFRLTMPMVAHVLHFGKKGMLCVFAVAGIFLLYTVLTVAYNVTSNKRTALFICAAIGSNWAGETAFHELRGGYYDAAALCLVMLALSAAGPLATGYFVFLAAWTDERALIACSFVFLFWMIQPRGGVRAFVLGKPGAILLAGAGYLGIRMCLIATHTFSSTLGSNVGLAVLYHQLILLPFAMWSGLGAIWIIVGWSLVALLRQGRYWMFIGFAASLALTMGVALSVIDVTRGMAYCLPAVFVALGILARASTDEQVERMTRIAAVLTFVIPAYYLEGTTGFWWLYSLPRQLIRWLL